MIGILYHRTMLHRLIRGKRSFEKPGFYMKSARDVGEEVIFFSLADVNWRRGTVKAWKGRGFLKVNRPIPPVIINRTRTNHEFTKQRIQRLKSMGKVIFNEHNVISKLEIHHILSQNPRLLPHLPATEVLSLQSIQDLLEHNSMLFLKPSTASIGNGIIRISRAGQGVVADINMKGRTRRKKVNLHRIIRLAKKRSRHYLVQQGVNLMKYKNMPVDFRVSMQKNGDGRWQYIGAVGKAGKRNSIVTNLHCGGISVSSSKLFQYWGWDPSSMERKFAKLGLRIARTLERELPHIADLGMDIAIDDTQHLWFIETNFRDLRITFRNAGEREKWRATFATPVQYAAYLIRRMNDSEAEKCE